MLLIVIHLNMAFPCAFVILISLLQSQKPLSWSFSVMLLTVTRKWEHFERQVRGKICSLRFHDSENNSILFLPNCVLCLRTCFSEGSLLQKGAMKTHLLSHLQYSVNITKQTTKKSKHCLSVNLFHAKHDATVIFPNIFALAFHFYTAKKINT